MGQIRTFIAVELGERIKQELASLQDNLRQRIAGKINWVKPEQMHITLAFLGDVDESVTARIDLIFKTIAVENKHFMLDLGAIGAYPNYFVPRVLWAGVNLGYSNLNLLSVQLESSFRSLGLEIAGENFHPHITLARIKSLDAPEKFQKIIDSTKPRKVNDVIDKIVLFRSDLSEQGPIHTPLLAQKLAG